MVQDSPGAVLPPASETLRSDAPPGRHFAPTFWIPRAVACRCCQEMATMEATEFVREDELIVRYNCPDCGWRQARHFVEQEMNSLDA